MFELNAAAEAVIAEPKPKLSLPSRFSPSPGMVTVADGESEFRKHRAARTARKIFEMIATEIVRRTANQMNRPLRARTRKIAQLDVIVHPHISLPVFHSALFCVNI